MTLMECFYLVSETSKEIRILSLYSLPTPLYEGDRDFSSQTELRCSLRADSDEIP
ncbi:MAG: hypothetical protein RL326_2253 [Pseudomonadota bacterium]|jgi:hypothetical protein